jgi:hypothetical protein
MMLQFHVLLQQDEAGCDYSTAEMETCILGETGHIYDEFHVEEMEFQASSSNKTEDSPTQRLASVH